jgi:hypothetical protein
MLKEEEKKLERSFSCGKKTCVVRAKVGLTDKLPPVDPERFFLFFPASKATQSWIHFPSTSYHTGQGCFSRHLSKHSTKDGAGGSMSGKILVL